MYIAYTRIILDITTPNPAHWNGSVGWFPMLVVLMVSPDKTNFNLTTDFIQLSTIWIYWLLMCLCVIKLLCSLLLKIVIVQLPWISLLCCWDLTYSVYTLVKDFWRLLEVFTFLYFRLYAGAFMPFHHTHSFSIILETNKSWLNSTVQMEHRWRQKTCLPLYMPMENFQSFNICFSSKCM